MKTKVDERFRILLWWVLLIAVLIFGLILTSRLKARIERNSYLDIEKTAEGRLSDIEKDFNYALSLLNLLGAEEDDFFKGNEKRFTFVREQLNAAAVGLYDSKTGELSISADPALSLNAGSEELKKKAKEVSVSGETMVIRGNSFFANGDLGLLVPVKKDGVIVGTAFSVFNIENYIRIISEPVYNGAGYCLLTDNNGNVLVPSEDFRRYMGNAGSMNDLETNEIFGLFDSTREGRFTKLSRDGRKYYVITKPFNTLSKYVLVIVVDEAAIFRNISPATKGVMAIICMVLVVTVTQSVYYVASFKKKKNEFNDVLNYDELTGLPTKPHHKNIATGILKKGRGNYAYAACDVSEFKYFNSTFSYEYGNAILKYIANVMSDALVKDETVSRTSGDHFALLLHYNDTDELTSRLMRILDTASVLPVTDDGRQPRAVFTCGVYLVGNETDINRIRARANVARKGLKKSISNQIAFYNEADFNNELEIHELQEDLLHAVDNKELVVFLQPKYGISNEEVIGAEALVRWSHKNKGLLSPNVFIPIAERIGLVKDIDFYVFGCVCRQLNQWKKEGKSIVPVSVNFSRVHLGDDDFVAKLIRVTRENDIEPKYLEIELTESAVYDEMERLLDIMYLIKEAGFGLSMDDFGSGYSSLHLLREMPVDVLKLDKGFLDDCGDDNQREKKVISHVISLAKDLQISVLAEGVETESQKNFLQEANCDMIQGYYYAKPMPMAEFVKYISEDEAEQS